MRRFNSSFLSYGWGLHRTTIMGKGWLESPVLWPCIWNIFSTDGGTRHGNASFTSPYRVIDIAESPAAAKDSLTMLFAPKKLFWVLNVFTYLKICKEGTFWRGDIPQLNQKVHLEIWKCSYHLSYQWLQQYGDLWISPDRRGLLLQATTPSGSSLAGGEMHLPVFSFNFCAPLLA